jgi:hypothetical protein
MSSMKYICDAGKWLDQPLSTIPTSKIGWLQKRLLLRGSIIKGEDVHNGPPVYWLCQFCPTISASVNGLIFKVAVTADYALSNSISLAMDAMEAVSDKLGFNGTPMPGGIVLWEADDGNAVIQSFDVMGDRKLSLFLTSNIARSFHLKK